MIVSWNDGEEQIRLLRSLPSKQILAGFYSAPVRDRAPVAAREAIGARVPLVTNLEPLVEDGMLASVEAVNHAYGERTAAIIEQVFRGANPAGIPIEFPRQFRVVVNRSTAAALGIALPPEVLLRADRVID